MTNDERTILTNINNLVEGILSGKNDLFEEIDNLKTDVPELMQLSKNVKELNKQYNENYEYILDISKGKLESIPPRQNNFANVYKQLQSELLHLNWQIQEIAKGDYEQKVMFSGDFSQSINLMIESLKEKQELDKRNKENEQLFQTIFDTSPDGFLISDLTGKIEYLSNSGMKMFGLTEDDIKKGICFFDFVHPEDKTRAQQNNIDRLKGNYLGFSEYRVIRKDGSTFWNETNAAFLKDSEGNYKSLFVVFRDITKRKADDEQLQKYTQELKSLNSLKDKFFTIIAHDLKNPFHAILGFTDFLKKSLELKNTEKAKKYAEIIYESSLHGYKLLLNLLDWSRSQSNRMEMNLVPVLLREIVNETLEFVSPNALEKNTIIDTSEISSIPVIADYNMLSTIFRNLLSNAIKFTNKNGKVSIKAIQDGLFVNVSISDNGIGIDEEGIDKLFRIDVSYSNLGTNNEKGTGLGLILCKDFISKMGGEIWVRSEINKGTTFIFSLPVAK